MMHVLIARVTNLRLPVLCENLIRLKLARIICNRIGMIQFVMLFSGNLGPR